MGVNFVKFGNKVLIDLRSLTITAEMLPAGVIAINAAGEIIVGAKAGYKNWLDSVDVTKNTYLSSSGGVTSTKVGYSSTGFIPIGTGSANNARVEQVIRLQGINGLPTDSYVRVMLYDVNKNYIAYISFTGNIAVLPENDTGNAAAVYNVDNSGYVNYIDITGYTAYLARRSDNPMTTAYFRLCAPTWGDDAIITVNEEIT